MNLLPSIYIIKSDRSGVQLPIKVQTNSIKADAGKIQYYLSSGEVISVLYDKYLLDNNNYPFEIDIAHGKKSNSIDGYASGEGDLWEWTYYCTLDKKDADRYYKEELKRVTKKYININKEKSCIRFFINLYEFIKNFSGKIFCIGKGYFK